MPPAAEAKSEDTEQVLGVLENGNVLAKINHLAQDSPNPRRIMYDDPLPEGVQGEVKPELDTRVIEILNGRDRGLNLVDNGLQLVPQPSQMSNSDFYNNEKIQSIFYPECEAAIKKHLPGVSRLVIFDHIVRGYQGYNKKESLKGGSAERVQEPVLFAHNDYTSVSAHRRIEELSRTKEDGGSTTSGEPIFKPEEVPELQNKRYIYLNVWRNIADYPVKDYPLAVCDGQTVKVDDLAPMTLVYKDRIGQVCMIKHREGQRWFYFPEMKNDEAMLLKCYDAEDNSGRWTAHSAFKANPPEGTFEPRQSIEVRTIAFFD